jgi:hypothetical protein
MLGLLTDVGLNLQELGGASASTVQNNMQEPLEHASSLLKKVKLISSIKVFSISD